jgi:hypothetical protein
MPSVSATLSVRLGSVHKRTGARRTNTTVVAQTPASQKQRVSASCWLWGRQLTAVAQLLTLAVLIKPGLAGAWCAISPMSSLWRRGGEFHPEGHR